MATKATSEWTNKRGDVLYTQEWLPQGGAKDVWAAFFWHHGFGEYSDRFDPNFKVFAEAGIAIFSFDYLNCGKSCKNEKLKGYIPSFQFLIDDAVEFAERVTGLMKTQGLNVPLFIGGNSLGGLISSYVTVERPQLFAGHLMQSPGIDVEWTPQLKFMAAIGGVISALAPKAKVVEAIRPEDISVDPVVVEEFIKDPILYKGNVMARSGNECLKGFRGLVKHRKEIKLPIFAVHGTGDKCTSLPALKEHLKHVSSTDITLKEIPDARHELLMGPEKEQVRNWMIEWMKAHVDKAKEAKAEAAPAKAEAEAAPAAAEAEAVAA